MSDTVEVSIIVPALNEAENLPLLIPRVHQAMNGKSYELIIVDDNSRDNTRAVCDELANKFPVKLMVREKPTAGLSGAVLAGMKLSRGQTMVVMDADLQHPPEKLPELLAPLEKNEADFVLGSRNVPGGETDEKWGIARKINSFVATALSRPFAGKVRDPMSGFFALRRSSYENATRLTPLGYKIGLELMCKARVQNVKEIPIRFGLREHGQSKLSLKQQFRYLEHLSRLYDFKYPRLSPVTKFLVVLLIGWALGAAIFFALVDGAHMGLARASVLSYLVNLAATAVFHIRYVRTQREFIIRPRPWLDFALIAGAELVACAASALWVTRRVTNPGTWETFVISYAVATIVRYILRKEFLFDIRGLRKELRQEELT